MTDIVISPAAERDLEDIWLAIADDNPRVATRILRTIGTRIATLAEYPRLCPASFGYKARRTSAR